MTLIGGAVTGKFTGKTFNLTLGGLTCPTANLGLSAYLHSLDSVRKCCITDTQGTLSTRVDQPDR